MGSVLGRIYSIQKCGITTGGSSKRCHTEAWTMMWKSSNMHHQTCIFPICHSRMRWKNSTLTVITWEDTQKLWDLVNGLESDPHGLESDLQSERSRILSTRALKRLLKLWT